MQETSPETEFSENLENSEERLVAPESHLGEQFDQSLRPERLSDYIGQKEIKENLEVFIGAAKKRGHALDHVLLSGPRDWGKQLLRIFLPARWGFSFDRLQAQLLRDKGI